MMLNPKKLAPYGLYLALLAAVVAAGLYIVQRSFNLPLQISLALIVVGIALYALLDPQKLKVRLAGRQARYGSNALILFVAFLGIMVVINYVVSQNSPRWDLTEDKTNTLTTETLDTLSSLTEPVKAEAFYSSRFSSTSAEDLLGNYKRSSAGNFDFEFIDPEQDPVRANSAGVTRDGTIVLTQNGRTEQVTFASEQELTNALVRLANPGQRSVYFLVGHGEYSPDDTGDRSYSSVKTTLEAKNYTVATLSLLAERQIPADALALIVAGPNKPLSQEEVQIIDEYLAQGGSLVYLVEPRLVTEYGDLADPLAGYLSAQWGIEIGETMVIDLNYNPPIVALSASYGQHPITEKMYNQATIMPSSRSVDIGISPADVTITPLVATSTNSWAETSPEELSSNQVAFTEGADLPGPIQLAAAATNSTTNARVVVIGDSDFAGGQYFVQYGNGDFIINTIDWAAQQESLINLTPKTTTQRFLVTPSQTTLNLLLLGVVIAMPGLVIVAGISVWIQRRRRG